MELSISDLDAVRVGGEWINVGNDVDLKVISVVDDDEGHADPLGEGRALIWTSGNKRITVTVDRVEAARWNT